jgi:hypothetical protein
MGIYIPTNSKIGSFISIACLVEVFSPDILIYFVIYLLNAMKGVRRGICVFGEGTEEHYIDCIIFPNAIFRHIQAGDSGCKRSGMIDREGFYGN